jgi:hypothetical protein
VRQGRDSEQIIRGLRRAFRSPGSIDAKKALFLKRIIPAQRDDYFPILNEYETVKNALSLFQEIDFETLG